MAECNSLDYIESRKSQKPLNEKLDQISSALSKLGYKSPTEPAKTSYQEDLKGLEGMISELSTIKTRFEEMKNQNNFRRVPNYCEDYARYSIANRAH